jgi:hypothetical protein
MDNMVVLFSEKGPPAPKFIDLSVEDPWRNPLSYSEAEARMLKDSLNNIVQAYLDRLSQCRTQSEVNQAREELGLLLTRYVTKEELVAMYEEDRPKHIQTLINEAPLMSRGSRQLTRSIHDVLHGMN